ncbi:C6 transcription factor [Penicillium sp. IBT 16267x]|nr:C6 transcription factor [Penicillium sp. IBT 16267x]
MDASTDASKPPARKPSSLACIICRNRHVKCDGARPVCGRCQTAGVECHYVQSRRGQVTTGPDSTLLTQLAALSALPEMDLMSQTLASEKGLDGLTPSWFLDESAFSTNEPFSTPVRQNNVVSTLCDGPRPPLSQSLAFDPMIQLYYENFHESHPFLLPRRCLDGPLAEYLPPYLLSAMRLIGAGYHYNQSVKDIHRKNAYSAITEQVPATGFKVQAMLLVAIVDHSHGFETRSLQTIQAAVKLAIELGMNKSAFGSSFSEWNPTFEESWRRTYWELFVVSAMMAAMGGHGPFPLHTMRTELKLPCDEKIYAAVDSVPPGQTLEQLQNNWARGSTLNFSSFAFRIEAVRLLLMVVALNKSLENTDDHQAEIIEARVTSLLMYLPAPQREIYGSDGRVDEMKIQTHLICCLTLIMLHQPRSSVRFGGFQKFTSCAQLRAPQDEHSLAVFDLRTVKLFRAADMLSNLATLPSPIRRRSPFTICALAVCVLVHSGACIMVRGTNKEEAMRVRVQLALGGLNMLGEIWPLAGWVKQQVLSIYKEMTVAYVGGGDGRTLPGR